MWATAWALLGLAAAAKPTVTAVVGGTGNDATNAHGLRVELSACPMPGGCLTSSSAKVRVKRSGTTVATLPCSRAVMVAEAISGAVLDLDPARTEAGFTAFVPLNAPGTAATSYSVSLDLGCFCSTDCTRANSAQMSARYDATVFTTGAAGSDVAPPGLLAASPHNGAYAGDSGADPLVLYFTEPVYPGSMGTGLITVDAYDFDGARDPAASLEFRARAAADVAFANDGMKVELQVRGALTASRAYSLKIGPGVLVDEAGNAFPGVTGTGSWSDCVSGTPAGTCTACAVTWVVPTVLQQTQPTAGASAVLPYLPIRLDYRDPVRVSSSATTALHISGRSSSILVERWFNESWVQDDATWAVGTGAPSELILSSYDARQLLLLPPRFAASTRYRITIPTAAIFYATYHQFEFTTQDAWNVLGTAKRCRGTGIAYARTTRAACARICEQTQSCMYMESDGTVCVLFDATANCASEASQVAVDPAVVWDDDAWVLSQKALEDADPPAMAFQTYDDPAPPPVGVSAQAALTLTFNERVAQLSGVIVLRPRNAGMRERPVLPCGAFWSAHVDHRTLPYLGPCSLDVNLAAETWRHGYVEMSKGVSTVLQFGPHTLIPGQTYDVEFPAGLYVDNGNNLNEAFTLELNVGNKLSSQKLYPTAAVPLYPPHGATRVQRSTSLRVRFECKPEPVPGQAIRFTADDGETFELPLDDPAQVVFVGNDLVLDPQPQFVDRIGADKTWSVDLQGAVANFRSPPWSFTTAWADNAPPRILEVFPAKGSTTYQQDVVGADGTSQITLRFAEQVQRGSSLPGACVMTLLHESSTRLNSFEFDVAVPNGPTGSVEGVDPSDPRRLVVLRPARRLIAGAWTLRMPSNCILDMAQFTGNDCNPMVALNDVATTEDGVLIVQFSIAADTTAPTVVPNPSNGSNYVQDNPVHVTLNFDGDVVLDRTKQVRLRSYAMDFSDDQVAFTLDMSDPTSCQFAWNPSDPDASRTVHFFFATNLVGARKYYLDIDPGAIADGSNNWFTEYSNPFPGSVLEQSPGDYFFTSALADDTAPAYDTSGFKPDYCTIDQTGQCAAGLESRTANVLMKFNEPVMHGTQAGIGVNIEGSGLIDTRASEGVAIISSDWMSALVVSSFTLSSGDNTLIVDGSAFTDRSASFNSVPAMPSTMASSIRLSTYGFKVVGSNGDTQPPTVVMVLPGGAVDGYQQPSAHWNAAIVIYFSEHVASAGNASATIDILDCGPISSYNCDAPTSTFSIASDGSSGGSVVIDGTEPSKVTVTPNSGSLSPLHHYRLNIAADSFLDSALTPNSMATATAVHEWDTFEDVVPVLLQSLPASGSTGLEIDGSVQLWFNEQMKAGSPNLVFVKSDNVNVTQEANAVCRGYVCLITPQSPLSTFTQYNLDISTGGITDESLNPPAGSVVVATLGRDTTSPKRQYYAPLQDLSVGRLADGTFTFDAVYSESVRFADQSYVKEASDNVCRLVDCGDDLDCTSGESGTANGDQTPVAVACSIVLQTLTVQTTGALAKGRHYRVDIVASALADLSGNLAPQETGYSFATVPDDTAGPSLVTASCFPSGSGIMFRSDHLLLRFSAVSAIMGGSQPLSVFWCGDDCACGTSDDVLHESVPMVAGANVAFGADRVWVDLAADLIPGGRYYVVAPSDTWRDETGAPSVAIGLNASNGQPEYEFYVSTAARDNTAPVQSDDAVLMTVDGRGVPVASSGTGATQVPSTAQLKIYFTEPVKLSTSSATLRFQYIEGGSNPNDQQTFAGDQSVEVDNFVTVDLNYQTGLASDATYAFVWDGGFVADTEDGYSVQSTAFTSTAFRFTMQSAALGSAETDVPVLDADAADATKPSGSKVYPAPGASDISVDAIMSMTFTEAANPIIANAGERITLRGFERDCTTTKDDATRVVSLTAADGSVVVNDGANTLYFRPPSALAEGTCYQVVISSGAITDSASPANSFGGLGQGTEPSQWFFSTLAVGSRTEGFDYTPPSVPNISNFFPRPGSTSVSTGSPVKLVFSEPVFPGTANISLIGYENGAVADTISLNINDATIVRFTNDIVDIYPPRLLRPFSVYTIAIPKGALRDANSNAFSGWSGSINQAYAFTTVYHDDLPPFILAVAPQPVNEHIPSYVPSEPAIVLYMSEDVARTTADVEVNWRVKARQTGQTVLTVSGKSNATAAHFLPASPHGVGNRSRVSTAGVANDFLSHATLTKARGMAPLAATVPDPNGFVAISGARVTFAVSLPLDPTLAGLELQLAASSDNVLVDSTLGLNGQGLAMSELDPYIFTFQALEFNPLSNPSELSFPLGRRLPGMVGLDVELRYFVPEGELDLVFAAPVTLADGTHALVAGRRGSEYLLQPMRRLSNHSENGTAEPTLAPTPAPTTPAPTPIFVPTVEATTTTTTTEPADIKGVLADVCVRAAGGWDCFSTQGLGARFRASVVQTSEFLAVAGGYDPWGSAAKGILYSRDGGRTWTDDSASFLSLPVRVNATGPWSRDGEVPAFLRRDTKLGVGVCLGVVQGWRLVVCGGGMPSCWHSVDEAGTLWQEGYRPQPAIADRVHCTLMERSDGGLVLMGGESLKDGAVYEDAWISYNFGDDFRQLTAKLAPDLSTRRDAAYVMMKDDTIFVTGGAAAGGNPIGELWKSLPGKIDRAGFGEHSIPATLPTLRTLVPLNGTTFVVANTTTGAPMHPVTRRLFEVYLVFDEEVIPGPGEVRVGPQIICRPKQGECIDVLADAYPPPVIPTCTIEYKKAYLRLQVDADFIPAGGLLRIDLEQSAVQDMLGNYPASPLLVTYDILFDSTPAEVAVGGALPAAGSTGMDAESVLIPFTKDVDLSVSTADVTISPVDEFTSAVTYGPVNTSLVQLGPRLLAARWSEEIPALTPGAQYEVRVAGVVDASGFLMTPASWRFTTRDGWPERDGAQITDLRKYTYASAASIDNVTVAEQVLSFWRLAQTTAQTGKTLDVANNISLKAERLELESSNPELEAALTAQQTVTTNLEATLNTDCAFPTRSPSGKGYWMYPWPITREVRDPYEVNVTVTRWRMVDLFASNGTLLGQENQTYEGIRTDTEYYIFNATCVCYFKNDAQFVKWVTYWYSWFSFISCQDDRYYTLAGCNEADYLPVLSSSCSSMLDDRLASLATSTEIQGNYTSSSTRLETVRATLDRLSYTGEDGPAFVPKSWPDNGATDVAGEIDIILKWSEDLELNTEGSIFVYSTASAGVLAEFTVDSPYLVVSSEAALGEYWLTIRFAKAVAAGVVTLPSGGFPALGTVSVQIPKGVVLDATQHYRPSPGIGPGEYSFTMMRLGTDTTAPRVVATAPAEAEEVTELLNTVIVQLSEPCVVNGNMTATLTDGANSASLEVVAPFAIETTSFKLLIPEGLLTQSGPSATWTLTLPAAFAVDGAVAGNAAAAFALQFTVARAAFAGLAGVTPSTGTDLPPGTSVIITFNEAVHLTVAPALSGSVLARGNVEVKAPHSHNSLSAPIEDAAVFVMQGGMYAYRNRLGESPLDCTLAIDGVRLFIAPNMGWPAGESYQVEPLPPGLLLNANAQASAAASPSSVFDTYAQLRFRLESSMPVAVFGGVAMATDRNELYIASGVGRSDPSSAVQPVGNIFVARTRRKTNCKIGAGAYTECQEPCADGATRTMAERVVTEPSVDGVQCIDQTGRSHASRASFQRLPPSVITGNVPCSCPSCIALPEEQLPPHVDMLRPDWRRWRSVSSANVALRFPCEPGYATMKDAVCTLGDPMVRRNLYYGLFVIEPFTCQPQNCSAPPPTVKYGSETDCSANFSSEGHLLHGSACDVTCIAGYFPSPFNPKYKMTDPLERGRDSNTGSGVNATDRQLVCEYGEYKHIPECIARECSPKPEERKTWDPEGGVMTCLPGRRGLHTYGGKCWVKCFPGFEAENDFTGPAKCTVQPFNMNKPEANAKYLSYVACPRQNCGVLAGSKRQSFNAKLNCTRGDNAFGDMCKLQCNRGFEPRDPENMNVSCVLPRGDKSFANETVEWKGGAGAGCKKLKCPGEMPRRDAVKNTIIDCPTRADNILRFSEDCNVRCKDLNYRLSGIPTEDGNKGKLTCVMNDDDTLSLNGFPQCDPVSCTTLMQDARGRMVPRSDKLLESTTEACNDLKDGQSCSVRCAAGYEPMDSLNAEEQVADSEGNILLNCREGVLWGPQYLKFTKVCKEKDAIVDLEPVVKSSVTITGSVDGSNGDFGSLRAWARDKKVQKVLQQVIAATVSSPEVMFTRKDIELDDPQAMRRLTPAGVDALQPSVLRWLASRHTLEERLEVAVEDDEDAPALRGRELKSTGTKVTFVVLMQGDNAKDAATLRASMESAMGRLANASSDPSEFLDALRMELFFQPDIYFPPGLDVMISEPFESVRVKVEGTYTTTTPPPTVAETNLTGVAIAISITVVVFGLIYCYAANRRMRRRGPKKVAPADSPGKRPANVAESPKSPKKGEPPPASGMYAGKPIEKPSDQAKGLLDDLLASQGYEEPQPSAGPAEAPKQKKHKPGVFDVGRKPKADQTGEPESGQATEPGQEPAAEPAGRDEAADAPASDPPAA
jgi:hypothetical protein